MKKIIVLVILAMVLASCNLPKPSVPVTGATKTPAATGTPAVNPSTGLPNFDHIILIVLENRSYSSAMDGSMPHLQDLAQKNVLLDNYYGASHPSLPNYIALMSGSTQNITSDCLNCFVDQNNLADEIEKSGRNWKAYLESMPSPCFIGDQGDYAQKHNPLLYFNDVRTNSNRCDKSILPLTQLDSDLSAKQLPNFAFIMPNLCNSGHNCSAGTADGWVNDMVKKLQDSDALGKNYLIAITFDEAADSDTTSCCGLGRGGGKVATVLISPSAKQGFTDSTPYSHYSLLKTFLTAWNLPALGKTDLASIQPITAPWGRQSQNQAGTNQSNGGSAAANVPAPIGCSISSPGGSAYTVKICFTAPAEHASLQGDAQVSASVDVTGTSAQVQRLLFYLDGKYILTTFDNLHQFTLPTSRWSDGNHTLSMEAMMRDKNTSDKASLDVTFANGNQATQTSSNAFTPATGSEPAAGSPFVVAAVGDGAGGGKDETNVVDLIKSKDPNLFLYLGDVYERGSYTEFYNWYGTVSSYYGQLRSITDPTIGNHDYGATNGAGYFEYWNNVPNYYSFDTHGWHIVSLNSNGAKVSTAAGSDQYNWLQKDLGANKQPCTIVYYHHPLFNIGTEGPTPGMSDIWKLLAQYKVTMVLNGHDHDYQRWVPLNGDGNPAPDGVTEFVVGTGGHGLQDFPTNDNRVAYSNNTNPQAFGALFLQLNPNGVNFTFENTDQTVLDSGVIPCAGAKADTQPPSPVNGLTADASNGINVSLHWNASRDNTGVAGYAIYRDGKNIGIVPGTSLDYTDADVQPSISYTYSVVAIDQSGRHSLASNPVKATIPGVAASLTFTPEADTYVNAGSPITNFGKTPFLRINGSPEMRGYIRFNISGLGNRTIAKARMLVYVNNNSKTGFDLSQVVDNKWNEYLVDYNQAPRIGAIIANSGPLSAGMWVTMDLSDIITSEGVYSFAFTTSSTRSISLAARESGANEPILIIDLN